MILEILKKFKRDNFYQSKSLKHFKVEIIFEEKFASLIKLFEL